MAALTIVRDTGYADRLRRYKVIVDGTSIGEVGNGETRRFSVSPGLHRVSLKIDWCGSKAVSFNLDEGVGLTKLVIRGARQHNLKNISVEIPRNSLTVITGLSGSGKSSLAFDTIYAEGQRRYVESLSAYARQFLDQMERPEVDVIEGLSP